MNRLCQSLRSLNRPPLGVLLMLIVVGYAGTTSFGPTSSALAVPPTQKKPAEKQEGDGKEKRAVRLPAHFGKLGLSDTQKEQLYEILNRHKKKIDQLEAALEEAKDNRDQELRKALSAEQRAMLKQLETKPKDPAM